MNVLVEKEGKIYVGVTIVRPGDFASPFPGAEFPCLIWDHGSRFTDQERSAVANAVLDSGCRYAVCGGDSCEAWHDAVDTEYVKLHSHDSEEVRAPAMVMTTWHTGESPDDVGFFFVLHTNFDHHDFQHYLVLHVGTSEAMEHVDAAVRKYALGGGAV